MHTFTHRTGAYLFDRTDGEDRIAQHFFTGGVMPSHHLIRQYQDLFEVEKEWRWSGTHYQRTALDWLAISIVTAMRSKAFFATSTTTIRTMDAALVLPQHPNGAFVNHLRRVFRKRKSSRLTIQ